MKKAPALDRIDAIDSETGCVNVVIETPKGSRNKYAYDGELAVFTLGGVLPAGAVFPFDFGFVPSTLGEDGDPLDVLLLLDESVPPGCLVKARLIGAIEAKQTEPDGKQMRNDRLLAVAAARPYASAHQDAPGPARQAARRDRGFFHRLSQAARRPLQAAPPRQPASGNEASQERHGGAPVRIARVSRLLPLPPGPSTNAQEGRGEGCAPLHRRKSLKLNDPHPALLSDCRRARGERVPICGTVDPQPGSMMTCEPVSAARRTVRRSARVSATQPSVGAKSGCATWRKIALPAPALTGASL